MISRFKHIIVLMLLAVLSVGASASEAADSAESKINPKDIIFDHLLDGYGWEVPFDHHHRIPLPVMCFASDGSTVFVEPPRHGAVYTDGGCTFTIGGPESKYKGNW